MTTSPNPAIGDVDTRERLRDELTRPPGGHMSRYMVDMWRAVLDCADGLTTYEQTRWALPYVPVAPETFGIPLRRGSRVADIGCLGGYGMFDLHLRRRRAGLDVPEMVGVDVDPDSVAFGERMGDLWGDGRLEFRVASCEELPFPDEAFDLVVARLVLPYTRVDAAISELRRVARRGGLILLQTHAALYYASQALAHVRSPRRVLYYSRALLAGARHLLTGSQPTRRGRAAEIPVGRSTLTRLCRARGLLPIWQGGGNRRPMTMFQRSA